MKPSPCSFCLCGVWCRISTEPVRIQTAPRRGTLFNFGPRTTKALKTMFTNRSKNCCFCCHLNTPPLFLYCFPLSFKTISFVHAKHILLVMPAMRDSSACSLLQPGRSHLTKPPSTFCDHYESCLSSSQQDRHWMPSTICVSVSGVLEYPKT